MTDVVGKSLREIHAVRAGRKSQGHLFLLKSRTYAAAIARRRLDKEFDRSRELKGFLVYTEDIKTGAQTRYPVAVDPQSGVVRQLNADRFGLLEDVEPCLHKRTADGAFLRWDEAAKLHRVWAEPGSSDIARADPAQSTYGSIAGGGRRVGQDAFREAVLKLWNGRCAITGCTSLAVLRASHILRWHAGTTDQRNDAHNGILLAAHFDSLFEAGLISFRDDGRILISPKLSAADRSALGVHAQQITFHPGADA